MATDIFEIEGTTIIETVRILNEEVYDFLSENYGGTFPLFELLTDGNSTIITFMGHHRLWFSDEDEREFDEEKDEYEPLDGYLRREAQEIINQIGNVNLQPAREIANTNEITTFLHCGQCLSELPDGESPQSYAQLEVGYTKEGLQVWCKRHNCNVIHLDFAGRKFHANTTRRITQDSKGIH